MCMHVFLNQLQLTAAASRTKQHFPRLCFIELECRQKVFCSMCQELSTPVSTRQTETEASSPRKLPAYVPSNQLPSATRCHFLIFIASCYHYCNTSGGSLQAVLFVCFFLFWQLVSILFFWDIVSLCGPGACSVDKAQGWLQTHRDLQAPTA